VETLHLHPAHELALWHAARRAATGTSADRPGALEAWRDPAAVLHPPLGYDDVKAIRAAGWKDVDEHSALLEVCRR
jgi:hypothetical protein